MKPSLTSRVTLEPAFILHRYDWSESSIIVEAFTRHHGRVALVAKGAKRPASNFRPVLLPMQPLRLTYSGDAEVKTLKSAEWVGGYAMPSGNTLLAGFYLNELMMRLLVRDDPHETIYEVYAQTISVIAMRGNATSANNGLMSAALRAFELLVLHHMGWLPSLTTVTQTQQALQPSMPYSLNAETGLCPAFVDDTPSLRGEQWQLLAGLADHSFTTLLSLMVSHGAIAQTLKTQLRPLLNYHCGQALKTPQTMATLQQL